MKIKNVNIFTLMAFIVPFHLHSQCVGQDAEPPQITCPNDIQDFTNPGECRKQITDIFLRDTSDNCGITAISWQLSGATVGESPSTGINDVSGEFFNVGETIVSYIARDSAGNTDSCTFLIDLLDEENPNILCPDDIRTTTSRDGTGNCTTMIDLGEPMTDDNCSISGNPIPFVRGSQINETFLFELGETIVEWRVSDASGNTSICEQSVIVEDDEDPIFLSCIPDTMVIVNTDCEYELLDYTTLIGQNNLTDNCTSFDELTLTQTPRPNQILSGQERITIIAEDESGNSSECSFRLIPMDEQDPQAVCIEMLTVYLDENGQAQISTQEIDDGSSDNCNIDRFELSMDNFSCEEIGNTAVTLFAFDESNNIDSCLTDIEVLDTLTPILEVPESITVETDPGECFATVNGLNPPILDDNCAFQLSHTMSGATSRSDLDFANGRFNVGSTIIQYLVRDSSGNETSDNFMITVVDNQAPSFPDCFEVRDQDENLDENCGYTVPDYSNIIGRIVDNCASQIEIVQKPEVGSRITESTQVFLVATDPSGNKDSCGFFVNLEDRTLPEYDCPADLTIYLDRAGNATLMPEDILAASSDNCVLDEVTVSQTTFDCTDAVQSPIDVEIKVIDGSGNELTCITRTHIRDTFSLASVEIQQTDYCNYYEIINPENKILSVLLHDAGDTYCLFLDENNGFFVPGQMYFDQENLIRITDVETGCADNFTDNLNGLPPGLRGEIIYFQNTGNVFIYSTQGLEYNWFRIPKDSSTSCTNGLPMPQIGLSHFNSEIEFLGSQEQNIAFGDSNAIDFNCYLYGVLVSENGDSSCTYPVFYNYNSDLGTCNDGLQDPGGNNQSRSTEVSIHPNPSSGRIVITSATEREKLLYELYNLNGSLIDQGITSKNGSNYQLNLTKEQPGIYILKLIDQESNAYFFKHVIQR